MYTVNSEKFRTLLSENKLVELRGLFLFAARLISLCEYILEDASALVNRYEAAFNRFCKFSELIPLEYTLHLRADIDRFCKEANLHVAERKKLSQPHELTLDLFHHLCPKITTTFFTLRKKCDRYVMILLFFNTFFKSIKLYPNGQVFYPLIIACLDPLIVKSKQTIHDTMKHKDNVRCYNIIFFLTTVDFLYSFLHL